MHSDRIAAVVREAPIADAGPPILACTNQTVRLDGSGSSDADGAVNAFSWNFGDGSSGGGERPTHVFERPGNLHGHPDHHRRRPRRLRRARHRRDHGHRRRGAADRRSSARTGSPPAPRPAFDAALVGDADVRGASFEWDFGDGATATGPTVEHAFAAAGTRTVTLRASLPGAERRLRRRSRRGGSSRVNAPPVPVIDAPGPRSPPARSCSSTPRPRPIQDGAITGFEWDLGDGSTASGVQAQHRFAAPGTYRVRLAVTDDAGVGNSRVVATRTVEVTPPPVAEPGGAAAALPGRAAPLVGRRGRRGAEGQLGLRRRRRGRRPRGRPRLRQARRLPGRRDPRRRRRPRQQPPHRGGLRPGEPRAGRRGRTRPHRLPRRHRRLRRRPLGGHRRQPHRLALGLQRRRGARGRAGRAQLRRARAPARCG